MMIGKKISKTIDFRRLVYLLPVILPVMCAAFGIVAVVLLLLGQFRNELVWLLGLLAAFGSAWILYQKLPQIKVTKPSLVATVFVLVFTGVWMGANFFYSSQHIYTNRDPGVYANGGLWLINHDQIQIPRSDAFKGVNQAVTEATSGFGISRVNSDEVYTQGAHLLPAFMGLAGRLAGPDIAFKIPPLLAGFALLALYGFARMVTREKWAIVATVAFAVSLPVIYFSRDSYSEMLATAFTFSSLALFVEAVRSRSKAIWIIAGAVAGASQLVRIDGILSMAGLLVALFIYLVLARKKERKERVAHFVMFLVPMLIVAGIGILYLTQLSSGYFNDLRHQVNLELLAAGGLFMVGWVSVWFAWRSPLFTKLDKWSAPWRARWAAIIAIGICLLLASRPLWMVSRSEDMASLRPFIESLQLALGSPVDGLRTYAEQTVNWLVWYTGPILVILATAGVAWVVYRAMKTKDLRWWAMVGVIVGAAVVYLNKPAITPDQIWASRRLLPVVMPGVAILGVIGLEWLESRKKLPWRMNSTALVSVLGTLAIVGPLFVSASFLTVRTHVPELGQMKTVCQSLPSNSAVVWMGRASEISVQPTRGLCGVPSAGSKAPLYEKKELSQLAKTLRKNGYTPVVGMVRGGDGASRGTMLDGLYPVSAIATKEYQSTLERPPHRTVTSATEVWLGIINDDGTISPIKDKESK